MSEEDPPFEEPFPDEDQFEEEIRNEDEVYEESPSEDHLEEQASYENVIPEGILEEEEDDESEEELAVEMDKQAKKQKAKPIPKKKRARNIIIVLLCSSFFNYLILGIAMHFSPNTIDKDPNGVLLLPGNFIAEILLLWTMIVVGFFLLYPLFPYLSKAYIHIHKLIKLKKFEYSVVTTDEHYLTFKEALGRFAIPYLFSFVLGYWFSTWFFIPNIGLPPDNYHAIATLVYFLFSVILMPVVIMLVPPLWLLDDAGIIAMKKRKEGERSIPDIEGPSVFFVNIFTGSAYTLAIVTVIDFFITVFGGGFKIDIFLSFLFVVFVLMPNTVLLIIYLYDFFFRRAKRRLTKILPNKLVDKMPKTVVDITAFNPFYLPEGLEIDESSAPEIDNLKEFSDFDIETEGA